MVCTRTNGAEVLEVGGEENLAKPEMVSFCVVGVTRHTPRRLSST